MARHFSDWLAAFTEYASFSEAPKRMHFWTGVSTIAGALRRRVWIDQVYFRWYPNFYIIFVAPPGIVSKSTTANNGMKLLRRVPGIHFGPDVTTWPALVQAFANCAEGFEIDGLIHTMSALTLESSEFGNLFNPQDREMVDLFVSLWDGKQGSFTKVTKGSGTDEIQNPWINLIACTTPSWIAGNFPEYLIGGGFTSRCVFVYAQEKDKLVAYPGRAAPPDMEGMEEKLVQDLTHISETLKGQYVLTEDAYQWGEAWYAAHYKAKPAELSDERFDGYLARKQSHIHKLAMVLAASCKDELTITSEDLANALVMTSDLERDMHQVFGRIGKTETSVYTDRLLRYVRENPGISYAQVYRFIHAHFPTLRDFEGVMAGLIRAGFLRIIQKNGTELVFPSEVL